ncbi:hypothetical protein SAMN02745170_02998 [Propionispora hippei DSM 15287]|uniref:Uncharacterized protein n=1 Tax=Propionispora hippei DSM 15287 TaxID=1123003 RepID=A0A1M6KZT7_9FIRM|nr:hypothetical protein SAMN02745170_02998 [Propionispora hippei DSM 15287]
MNQSQENCLFDSHRFYLRAMGKGIIHEMCVFPADLGRFLFFNKESRR